MSRTTDVRLHPGAGMLRLVAGLLLLAVAPAGSGEGVRVAAWGSSELPFAADSPWNSRPLRPVLGEMGIPPAHYPPAILANGWSTGVFVSKPDDPPVTVRGRAGSEGLWNPDDQTHRDVRVPRWPSDVNPAAESDGHADIVDPVDGVIHSFWQLRREKGEWVAAQYAWSSLRGRGWGDPAHYFQGARAAGVPAMAGLIRRHEVNDGARHYRHALAVSLATNALASNPAYVFPATSADSDAASRNTGAIAQGSLLMLPPSFDAASLNDKRVRKIAETLKVYGAYVVDRNDGTPFVIYAEIGSDLDLHRKGWNRDAVEDLERIRRALRPVVDAQAWVDGNGRQYRPERDLNLLSMRGPWKPVEGDKPGRFDTWTQSLMLPASSTPVLQKADLPDGLTPVAWGRPEAGRRYCLGSEASGGAKLRMTLTDRERGATLVDSGELGAGQTYRFNWPSQPLRAALYVSGGRQASSARAILRACADDAPPRK